MAEKACRVENGSVRRPSFRKSLAEAGLPQEYLDALEQKRRQLDESIHKYIAAKEREYKQYEKDLKQQRRASMKEQGSEHLAEVGELQQRRALSEGTPLPLESLRGESLAKREQRGSADSQAILDDEGEHEDGPAQPGSRQDMRGGSKNHNKELSGLFTPSFLSALEDDARSMLERTTSAPISYAVLEGSTPGTTDLQRANSDTYMQARPKRPVHLQLAHRTSSSGSSVDGKLVSAMKSPAHSTRNRNRRKRVSLAVGDVIVAPADNVPVPLSNNRRASHSRLRSPAPDRERLAEEDAKLAGEKSSPNVIAETPSILLRTSHATGDGLLSSSLPTHQAVHAYDRKPIQEATVTQNVDTLQGDVGDMWHLEDSDDGGPPSPLDLEPDLDGEASSAESIGAHLGRLPSPSSYDADKTDLYGNDVDLEEAGGEEVDSAVHLEFQPGSVAASQQPTTPGFRRPSVSADPAFRGINYDSAAVEAETNGVYGSSYSRPIGKGSFTAGSLGESYMARNAEWLSKLRSTKRTQQER